MAFKQVVEESRDEKKSSELGDGNGVFAEGEKLSGAAKGKIEEEGVAL